jgi:hypothetical protein
LIFNMDNIDTMDNNNNNLVNISQFLINKLQNTYTNEEISKYNIEKKILNIIKKRQHKIDKEVIVSILKSITIYINNQKKKDTLEKNTNEKDIREHYTKQKEINSDFNIPNNIHNKNNENKLNNIDYFHPLNSELLQTVNKNTTNKISNNRISDGILSTNIIKNNREPFTNSLKQYNNNKKYDLYIDSKDRDFNKYELPNDYIIDLSSLKLKKVKKIKLVECIIIKSDKDPQSSDSGFQIPYIILNLDTISKSVGSSDLLNDNFTTLKYYEQNSSYKYYRNLDTSFEFTTPYYLKELNIKFLLPGGELFNFGYNNNMSFHTVNFIHFELELY